MSESTPPTHAPTSPGDPASDHASAMEELRRLLIGEEQVKLSGLERRIEDPTLRVEDVSDVLPQAVARSSQKDGRLAGALAPAVEESLRASIRRDPGVLANAIFPIIGPAIRKAVGDSFRRVVQSFSTAMEHSFTWRGLRWRMDAWRTGRPMAEVVLYHTLLYRVEQVFLIHRPSGLLLLHLSAPGAGSGEEDLVAGMLSAVRDFVHDSFSPGPGDELQTVQVGELGVWVEGGPHAILAGAIRGHAPAELRHVFQSALESVHAAESSALAGFRGGDVSQFALLSPILEECLQERLRDEEKPASPWKLGAVVGVLAVILVVWLGSRWLHESRRDALVRRLRSEPGILVTEVASEGSRLRVEGLMDPLATDPGRWVAGSGLATNEVEFRWEPYLALSREMVLRRVRARVEIPEGVELTWADGVLGVSGVGTRAWWDGAKARMATIPGVERVDAAGLLTDEAALMAEALRAIGEQRVLFGDGVGPLAGHEGVVREVAALYRRLDQQGREQGRRPVLVITGHTDRSGPDSLNGRLSAQRAEWVRERLVEAGLSREVLEVNGVGSRSPQAGLDPAAPGNRRVTFSIRWRS